MPRKTQFWRRLDRNWLVRLFFTEEKRDIIAHEVNLAARGAGAYVAAATLVDNRFEELFLAVVVWLVLLLVSVTITPPKMRQGD